jgi:hypothetical protein
MPIAICEAPTNGENNHNTYYIKGDISTIYTANSNTSLTVMMFLASQSSVNNENAQICFLPKGDFYPLKAISDAGFERDICEGDIVANKVCFIRYNPITENIILINPSMDKEASVTNLTVYNEAKFNVVPRVRKEILGINGAPNSFEYENLISQSSFDSLVTRVNKLERRFIMGIEDPKDALEGAENGTIYLKLGDILN